MDAKLLELIKTQKICCVFTDESELDKFNVGFIRSIDDTFYLMEAIDPNGQSDGLICCLIQNVIKIEVDTRYCNKILRLIKLRKKESTICYENGNDVVVDLLKYAIAKKKICSIELCESDIFCAIGYVTSIENEIVNLKCLDKYGENDGVVAIKLEKISFICCDGLDEKSLGMIQKHETARSRTAATS